MKSLRQYIIEKYEEELEIKDGIDYVKFAELLMFLDQHDEFNERKQAVCDVFRRSYSTNITKETVRSSEVFQRLIDDLIKKYKENEVPEDEKFDINLSTRKHIEDDIAAKMLVKIRLEQEMPRPKNLAEE